MSTIISREYFDFLCRSDLKIAFFGGSFNPFHIGHENLVRNVIKKFDFDKLIILVAHYSSIKKYDTSAKDRAKEIYNKFFHPKVYISAIEEDLDFCYSALITKYISNKSGRKKFMILGGDSAIYFHQWEYYSYILDTMNVILVNRSGYTYQALNCKIINDVYAFERFKYTNISSTEIKAQKHKC